MRSTANASDEDLVDALKVADREVIVGAALEIGRRAYKIRGAVTRLRDLLRHPDREIRESAAEALGKIGARSAVHQLAALLMDTSQPLAVRDTSAYALALIADARAVPALEEVQCESGLAETLKNCVQLAFSAISAARAKPAEPGAGRLADMGPSPLNNPLSGSRYPPQKLHNTPGLRLRSESRPRASPSHENHACT